MPSGRLTIKETAFIDDNWVTMSDEAIAKHLGRNTMTITRYRRKKKFTKSGGGKVNTNPESNVNHDAVLTVGDDNDKMEFWKQKLRDTPRYKIVSLSYTAEQLELFETMWAEYHLQFEDMTTTEEDAIDTLISLRLRLYDNQIALKHNKEYEYELQDELNKILEIQPDGIDTDMQQQNQLREMIIANNRQQLELNKEYRELTDRLQKLMASLNATREQRESGQRIGSDTFLKLVNSFIDHERRAEANKYNELMRISTEEQQRKLSRPQEFLDGSINPVYMDSTTIDAKENDE